MLNAGLDEAQAGIKIARRNINNLRHTDDITLMAESEELKSLLMKVKVKEESEKAVLNSTFKKLRSWHPVPYFMANRWENSGNSGRLNLRGGASKIIADGDCSLEMKRCLFLRKKAMTNLDSTLKSRDIILPTKVRLVKATVFPVVMYGCES